MSILVPVLLTLLALSARQGHAAALLPPTSTLLKESITWLNRLLETEVSCDNKNVTSIFAGDKNDDDIKMLCQATRVTQEHQSCHVHLKALYLNLFRLVQRKSAAHKAPCPVAAGNTTSLNNFLGDLRRLLQKLVKDLQSSK